MEISKELLSEVFDQEVSFVKYVANNTYEIHFEKPIRLKYIIINIYELAYKCKEWAYKRGFLYWYENSRLFIKIMYSCKVDFEIDIGEYKKPFEIDIDFKACQWISNNKESV